MRWPCLPFILGTADVFRSKHFGGGRDGKRWEVGVSFRAIARRGIRVMDIHDERFAARQVYGFVGDEHTTVEMDSKSGHGDIIA